MRSAILILLTVLLVGGGLALYTLTQSPPAPKPLRTLTGPTTARATTGESIRGVGSGESAWVKRYENGELHSQFRGDKYEPQKDGTVHVVRPQAEFFATAGRQRVRIEGLTGDIVTALPPEQNDGRLQSRGADMSAPNRGTLQGVIVSVFEPADAAEPVLTARMNNAAFDTDKFRIATEGYTDKNGQKIAAENVPVVVRGRDYDFDGKGLVIGWNERDRKLTLLEVTHGEQLVVKNSTFLSAPPKAPTQPHAAAVRQRRRGPLQLASTDLNHASLLLAAARPATRRKPPGRLIPPPLPTATSRPIVKPDLSPVVYRATFEKNVRIFEGDTQIGTLDQMNIDILQVPEQDATTQASPTTARSTRKRQHVDATEPTTTATTKSTTARGPITVKWSGKLRVVPLEGTPDPNLIPEKPIVRMTGSPAILMLNGAEARCGQLVYNSADNSARLAKSDAVPLVTLKDPGGAHITTPQLNYHRLPNGESVATLIGNSRAELPIESTGQTKEIVTATWFTDGHISMLDDAAGKTVMQQIDLTGDVNVEHPQLNLKGKSLSIAFDPPSSSPSHLQGEGRGEGRTAPSPTNSNPAGAIREILASGDVRCQILDEKQPRSIKAQRLRVSTGRTPQNKTYAKRIEADGDVLTTENKNELRAGHLAAELEPSTQPVASINSEATGLAGGDVKLIALDARDNVRLSTPDGASATGDTLSLDHIGSAQAYRLAGNPAIVTDGKNTLKGSEIRIAPDINLAEIPKGGSFVGASPDDPKQTVSVQWAGVATLSSDYLDVDDQVVMSSTQQDGTVNAAKSKHLRAKLEPKPTTKPTTKVATTKPTDPRAAFMSGKQLTKATLTGDVKVKSELSAPDGFILRDINLVAQTVTYDQVTRRFEVPEQGQMIYRDHRAPDAKDAKLEGPSVGSGRGDTVFTWTKNLAYDPDASRATMNGDVKVIHNSATGGQNFNIDAQTITATMEPDTKATTKPANAMAANLKVKRVTASGDVHVQSKRLNFDGPNLAYEPGAQVLTATGDGNNPVTVYDNGSGSTSQAQELWWNTETDQFKIKKFTGRVR